MKKAKRGTGDVNALIAAATALADQFIAMKEHQQRLLVLGQTLESASRNWDDHPEAFSEECLDFEPLLAALTKLAPDRR